VLDGSINDVGAYIRTNLEDSYRLGIELDASTRIHPRIQLAGNIALSRNKAREFTNYLDNWDTGLQETETFTNTDLSFSPGIIGRYEIQYDLLKDKDRHQLSLNWNGKYVGEQYLDNTQQEASALDPWLVHNLRINYSFSSPAGQKIHLIGSLNNLFDTQFISNGWIYRYRSPSYDDRPYNPYTRKEANGNYNQTGYFPQAGRNWMLSLMLDF
jgi:iron complex outermembrane receptor protein